MKKYLDKDGFYSRLKKKVRITSKVLKSISKDTYKQVKEKKKNPNLNQYKEEKKKIKKERENKKKKRKKLGEQYLHVLRFFQNQNLKVIIKLRRPSVGPIILISMGQHFYAVA